MIKRVKMPLKCCVFGCKWNSDDSEYDKRSLFQLPSDPIVVKRLLNQLKFEDDFVANDRFRMCEKHFTADSFKPYGGFVQPTTHYIKHFLHFRQRKEPR